jgi:hypothetical protein
MEMEINTFADRRRVREELERQGVDGERVDVGVKCRCQCGDVHYRRKTEKDNDGQVQARTQQEEDDNTDLSQLGGNDGPMLQPKA